LVFFPFQAVVLVVAVAVDDFGLLPSFAPPLPLSLEGDDDSPLVGVDVPPPLLEVEARGDDVLEVLPQAPMGAGNDLIVGAAASPDRGGKSNGFSVIWSAPPFSPE